MKKGKKSINFDLAPGGGGSGPKHSAFCGACFSINPYRSVLDRKRRKSDQKNHEPSTFFKPLFEQNLIIFDPIKVDF
jgi:hypothetical protein